MRRIIGTIKNNNPFPLFQHYGHIPAKEHKGGGELFIMYSFHLSYAQAVDNREDHVLAQELLLSVVTFTKVYPFQRIIIMNQLCMF